MIISAEQLARIVIEIRREYESSPIDLTRPQNLADLALEEYPSITGVSRPPSPVELERRFLREFWASYEVPSFDPEPGPTIGVESRENIEYNERLRAMYHGMPPPSPAERMMSELNLLRSNPMAALTYVTMRATHHTNEESILYSRAAGGAWDILSCMVAAPVSDVSGRRERSGPEIPEAYTTDFITSGLRSL
jgi:hypothetical protein